MTLNDLKKLVRQGEGPTLELKRSWLAPPQTSLREILVNALIHRDYSIAGGYF